MKLDDISDKEWTRIIKELTIYTIYQFKYYSLIDEHGLKGNTAEEIAMKAIEKVLVGEWNWDSNKSDLLTYLKFHVVKGLMSNLLRSKEKASYKFQTQEEYESHKGDQNIEAQFESENSIDLIRSKIEDKEALIIFDGLLEGMKRREICKQNSWPNKTYDNAVRRLNSMIEKMNIKEYLK